MSLSKLNSNIVFLSVMFCTFMLFHNDINIECHKSTSVYRVIFKKILQFSTQALLFGRLYLPEIKFFIGDIHF